MEVICPLCGKNNISFKLFGYPSHGMEALERTGKFILGGCVPGKNNWYCHDCDKGFSDKSKFPCGFCTECNCFLAPKDVTITHDGDITIKTCLTCGSKIL